MCIRDRMRCTVSEPIATAKAHRITNVSSAETPASRTRIGSRSKLADRRALTRPTAAGSLGAKDVARSPDRVQQALIAVRLELAAQVGHEHLDGVGLSLIHISEPTRRTPISYA